MKTLLLTVDGEDAIEVFAAIEGGVVKTSEVLQVLSDRVRGLVRLHWPRMVIVPLLRGRPLANEGISIDTLVATSPGWKPEWWSIAPRPLASADLELAGLARWELPDLEVGRALVETSSVLLAIVNHVADLPVETDLDSLGREILTTHLDRLKQALQGAIGAMITSAAAAKNWTIEHNTAAASRHIEMVWEALALLGTALQRLGDPQEEGATTEDQSNWRACTAEIKLLSFGAYLAIASEVARRDSMPKGTPLAGTAVP